MKRALFILLASEAPVLAEGVFSGAPNPGLLRHPPGDLSGAHLLWAMAVTVAALAVALLPRRERPAGVRVAGEPLNVRGLWLPTLLLIAAGEGLVLLNGGGVAAMACVVFCVFVGLVSLSFVTRVAADYVAFHAKDADEARGETIRTGLAAIAEAAWVSLLLFLLGFLPHDCAALGLLCFVLAQMLVTGAILREFARRLAARAVRGQALLVALVYLLQTAFEPVSIEALVAVEFYLAVRLGVAGGLFVSERFLQPTLTGDLSALEAVRLRGWLRFTVVVAVVCLVAFVVLDRFRAEGFYIHRDLWWSLPLPLFVGLGSRLVLANARSGVKAAVLVGGLLLARLVGELEPLRYFVSGTHDFMAWGLALVLFAWGCWLGDGCDEGG